MTRKTLRELYAEHTGKVSDKWSLYLTEYDRLFAEYRDRPVRLLEIGVQNGGSLEIWAKYFSQASVLIGCDINPECARLSYEDSRIGVVVGHVNAPATREQLLQRSPQFDIVIDDGSHRSSDIVRSFALYFSSVAEGGLFLAEDLHCSYWSKYEGGLFYPYSSISFFKALADVISHEHWGVPRERSDVLRGILKKYNCDIDADALSQVHSIEFVNSICVVRKARAVDNQMGHRVVAGSVELVVPGHPKLHGSAYELDPSLVQSGNSWSTRSAPPGETVLHMELSLAHALQQNAALKDEVAGMRGSYSWRVTAPLRFVGRQVRRLKPISRLASYAGRACRDPLKAWRTLRRLGWSGIKARLRGDRSFANRALYAEWLRSYDPFTDKSVEELRQRQERFAFKPLISVLMPVFNPKRKWLTEAIDSVRRQIYPCWELCIADDASTDPAVREVLEQYAREDARVKVCFRERNGHIAAASNSALALATGQFVALLDHDDKLHPLALHYVAQAIVQHPDAGLIFTDEDKVDDRDSRHDPYFKCEFNYELFLAQNMINHLGVYRRDLVHELGGFRDGFAGSQDYDLALRVIERLRASQIVHVPRVLYHWRVVPGSTALDIKEKPYAVASARKAIEEHLERRGVQGAVLDTEVPFLQRVRYSLPSVPPTVTIIIPTRNRADLLQVCLASLSERTTYPNYDVLIVDNGSTEQATLDLLQRARGGKIRVVRDDSPFNFSALNNRAVAMVGSDYVCLMNNDIEVVTREWLEEMLAFAIQKDVGAVGARLWYPDGRLQHGGVILGVGGVAGHAHRYLLKGKYGYASRAVLHQSLSAVTAACLLIRKSTYVEVGGMDESLSVAFNDVDFCLRVREAGYRNVWTPFAEMVHHESASRGLEVTPEMQARFSGEVAQMWARWGDALTTDPAYSVNLSLEHEDFSSAWPPRLSVP